MLTGYPAAICSIRPDTGYKKAGYPMHSLNLTKARSVCSLERQLPHHTCSSINWNKEGIFQTILPQNKKNCGPELIISLQTVYQNWRSCWKLQRRDFLTLKTWVELKVPPYPPAARPRPGRSYFGSSLHPHEKLKNLASGVRVWTEIVFYKANIVSVWSFSTVL